MVAKKKFVGKSDGVSNSWGFFLRKHDKVGRSYLEITFAANYVRVLSFRQRRNLNNRSNPSGLLLPHNEKVRSKKRVVNSE
jgi:hypothetical protein